MTLSHDNTKWLKSTRSETQGACVLLGNTGAVKDSKNPDGPALPVDVGALIGAVKADRLTR